MTNPLRIHTQLIGEHARLWVIAYNVTSKENSSTAHESTGDADYEFDAQCHMDSNAQVFMFHGTTDRPDMGRAQSRDWTRKR